MNDKVYFKANDIASWFLIRDRNEIDITHLKLQKLLYYAQGVYLAIKKEPLFEEDIVAWQHGPVVKEVYDNYKQFKDRLIRYNPQSKDYEVIKRIENDEIIRDVLEFVFNEYGQFSAWKLRDMTHEERPWKETDINNIISNSLIQEYFENEVIEVE